VKGRRAARGAACLAAAGLAAGGLWLGAWGAQPVLRIQLWPDGKTVVSAAVKQGDEFFFGWEHSLEKIPWDEFYHVDEANHLVLDTIRFPAFGAGIPESAGETTWIEDGMIYMGGIGREFTELKWLNSATATKEIRLNGTLVAEGASLPAATTLRLTIGPRWP
jgi:hypothetical protein